jgi:enterochelin esterase-like enzyme
MKRITAAFVSIALSSTLVLTAQTIQQVCSGKLIHVENFQSKYVDARNVDIWLPDGYDGKKKFDVLYMHDGQMLFDSATTWNKQTWDADDVASVLMKNKQLRDFIIVGVWNAGAKRHSDYFPQRPFEQLTAVEKDTVTKQLQQVGRTNELFQPQSDKYLQFLVTELKPFVDANYRVHKTKEHTFIAGSSMGGLISMYAVCEYPEVFGGAACLSTHWLGTFTNENNPVPAAFISYLKQKLSKLQQHTLYFDCGDQTLDAFYPPYQKQVDAFLTSYNNKRWKSAFFPGTDHSEKAWHNRLHIPLQFLFGK